MPNMAAIISSLKIALLTQRTQPANIVPPCYCRTKTNFPMKGLCRESVIIYKATLISVGISKNHYGCSETELKTRYYNHNQSFKRYKNIITESYLKPFGKLKTQEKTPSSNGASRPAPHHTIRELNGATSAWQKNSSSSKRILPPCYIKEWN